MFKNKAQYLLGDAIQQVTQRHSKPITTRALSLEFDYKGKPTQQHIEPPKRRPQFVSATVMLVWLESFEDHLQFPVGKSYIIKFEIIINYFH